MRALYIIIGCFFVAVILSAKGVKRGMHLMGVQFEVTAVCDDEVYALKAVDAAEEEMRRIEALISSWDSTTQTSTINRMAGIAPISVDDELFQLVKRSIKVSHLTSGAFDITFASINKIWHFDGSMKQLPSSDSIAASVSRIGYQKIQLNDSLKTIFLPVKGMKIGFGAIGKGYAANRAKRIMMEMGIKNGNVNASGDLIAWGTNRNNQPWRIGIADPLDRDKVISWLDIGDMSVVTSGNYEKYAEIDGKRYCHIIDPRTGYPVEGVQSVTIICPDAEIADALATSVMVLGEKAGLALINKLNAIECLIYTADKRLVVSTGIILDKQ